MIDLLGILDLGSQTRIKLAPVALPSERYGAAGLRVSTVEGQCLAARFVGRVADYHTEGGLHVFVVGEARLRLGSSGSAEGPGDKNPLSAERVLALFKGGGVGLIEALKGNFCVVLIDEVAHTARLVNGRYGISPFYYALDGRAFVFATSMACVAGALAAAPDLDVAGVTELALFNYPLGDRTYFNKVKMLRPAEIVTAGASGLRRGTWWDVRSLYDQPVRKEQEALDVGSELFHRVANDLAGDVGRVSVSFTSGFDSRAILAVLEKEHKDVLAYSFGTPGSINVSVPQEICASIGIPYHPVTLDEAYERVFDENALRAVVLSDNLSTVERANYPYAFELLAHFSPIVVTGLFGSELLRTFQNVGHIVSGPLVRACMTPDGWDEVRRAMRLGSGPRYFSPGMIRAASEEVEEDLREALWERFEGLTPDRRFYMFLLTEGLRKYFGAEVAMERPWGINRFPFLDDDFVEFAFSSPFAGVHSRTLTPTIANRFRSQLFYAHVIRRYRPELLEATTDHGYSPAKVLARFPLLPIGLGYLRAAYARRFRGYREFRTEEWTQGFYHRHLLRKPVRGDLFTPALSGEFVRGCWLEHRLEFARAASLKLWLEALEERGAAG